MAYYYIQNKTYKTDVISYKVKCSEKKSFYLVWLHIACIYILKFREQNNKVLRDINKS